VILGIEGKAEYRNMLRLLDLHITAVVFHATMVSSLYGFEKARNAEYYVVRLRFVARS